MDDVDVEDIAEFEDGLLDFVRTRYSGLLAQIRDTGELPEDDLVTAINEYKASQGSSEL